MVYKELLEAALDSLQDGVALLSENGQVLFWNRAAEAITGFPGMDLLARQVPEALEPLLCCACIHSPDAVGTPQSARGMLVHANHKLGHIVAAMARTFALRDALGEHLGTAVVFHPAESLDALPHGESGDDTEIEESQVNLEDRLATLHGDFALGGPPFGVLWIAVDQALELRKTHGVMACEAMLDKVERAMANGLRPGEELGRWGEFELLIVSCERTPEMLAAHGRMLAGLARTADFRWWGDRVSLTVSIGAAQSEENETLAHLLERAQYAMASSMDAGGNHITLTPGRHACLPS